MGIEATLILLAALITAASGVLALLRIALKRDSRWLRQIARRTCGCSLIAPRNSAFRSWPLARRAAC